MELHLLKRNQRINHFKSSPLPYIIFQKIVEDSYNETYRPLDAALLDLCKLHCDPKKTGNLADYYKKKFEEFYVIWINTTDWQNMSTCSIYAYLYYRYSQSEELINKISQSIEQSGILDNMVNLGKYPRMVGFSLGLILNGPPEEILSKLYIDYQNLNYEKKVFILYYFFGRKLSGKNIQMNYNIKEFANNMISDQSLDFKIRMPALLFIDNSEVYFNQAISSFVNDKFYELAFGAVGYSIEDFDYIADLSIENIVKFLIISKSLGWDSINYVGKEEEKEFQKFLTHTRKGHICISWGEFAIDIFITATTFSFIVYLILSRSFWAIFGVIFGPIYKLLTSLVKKYNAGRDEKND
jgi:hypothetical protein